MKKYGKYETRPEGTPAKQPKAKSMLLQTYLTSLLCMVLCVTMFFGTSYAWFTSEVVNEGNEIYIGILDVDLLKQIPDGTDEGTDPDYVSMAAKDGEGKSINQLYSNNIHWEPGYTSLETVKVKNEGDLAFNYIMTFTDGKLKNKADEELSDLANVAKFFEVWVFDHQQTDAERNAIEYSKPASYTVITAENSGWDHVGTLADVLAGKAVFEGKMDKTAVAQETTEHTYTIALHMDEAVTKEDNVMGRRISLNVKLTAYQMGSEEDSFGKPSYDENAHPGEVTFVSTVEELQEALDNATDNAIIQFANDIAGDVTVTQKPDVKITIDGNDKTFAGVILVDGKSATYTTAGLTIKNVKFKADSISADACIRLGDGTNATRYTCNVTVEDCIFDVPGAVGVKSYTGGDKNLTIVDCTATDKGHSLVQAKGIDGILIKNCKVYSKNGLNFNNSDNVKVIGCTVATTGYCVRFGESSGGVGTKETYLIQGCDLKSNNADGDAVIILRGTADYATLTIENTTITGTPDITNTATEAKVVNG